MAMVPFNELGMDVNAQFGALIFKNFTMYKVLIENGSAEKRVGYRGRKNRKGLGGKYDGERESRTSFTVG